MNYFIFCYTQFVLTYTNNRVTSEQCRPPGMYFHAPGSCLSSHSAQALGGVMFASDTGCEHTCQLHNITITTSSPQPLCPHPPPHHSELKEFAAWLRAMAERVAAGEGRGCCWERINLELSLAYGGVGLLSHSSQATPQSLCVTSDPILSSYNHRRAAVMDCFCATQCSHLSIHGCRKLYLLFVLQCPSLFRNVLKANTCLLSFGCQVLSKQWCVSCPFIRYAVSCSLKGFMLNCVWRHSQN